MTAVERAGTLLLVATPIGNLGDLSTRAAEALRDAITQFATSFGAAPEALAAS